MKVTTWTQCRLCGERNLETILDLGVQGLPKWPGSLNEEVPASPLEFCVCTACGLGQLRHSIDRESLFREYWYRTGVNATMRQHMAAAAAAATKETRLRPDDVIIDIGCNDGTLLRAYGPETLKVGFEPSNLCPSDSATGISWVNDFFHPDLVPDAARTGATIVTTMSMIYYLDDPIEFARQIKSVLGRQGIWICEMNYAREMIEKTTFDHISHEHVTTWSATTFRRVTDAVGLEIFRVELNELNGGSIRFWIGFPSVRPVEMSVNDVIEMEAETVTVATYRRFARSVRTLCDTLRNKLESFQHEQQCVMCYGASTRGLTILEAAGIGSDLVRAAVERNEEKFGRYYGATGIPIISETQMRAAPPDYLLVLPYSFIHEFVQRECDFLRRGGRFIVPVPTPHVIDGTALQPVGNSGARS